MELLNQIATSLQEGDDARVGELTRQAVAEKTPARQILDEGLIAGMNVVGRLFRDHEIFLPDVLLAARAMYAGLDVLKPLLVSENVPTAGKVVIGTVQGDLHDIGKNLVGIMLRGAGFDVIDLGNDVAPEKFVETATRENAQVIGMSALLTTTMTGMQRVVELLHAKGQRGRIKTIIGGAPVTAEYAREIGADAFGFDAASAVERVKELAAR
ncbi:MAG: corrinoid protein [candidate division WOR-3 bacterium]|nr:corrinoid protein [candidate division WOR-3 bacterium]